MTQVQETELDLEGLRRKIYRRSHSLRSITTFNMTINTFSKFLKEQNLNLEEVLNKDPYKILDSFAGWLDEKNYRVSTQRVYLHYVKRIFSHNNIIIDREMMREKVVIPKKQIFADEPLTPEVARLILLETKNQIPRLILCLIKDTVARPSELLSLKLSHFNLTHDPPYLTIPAYAAKNDIEREVFFTQETKDLLISYLKDHKITKQTQHLFLKGNPDPIEDEIGFQRAVEKALVRLEQAWRLVREKPAMKDIFQPIEQRSIKRAYKIHIYSFKKFAFTKIADILGDIAAHAIAGHEQYLITYYKKTREERAEEYRKIASKLQLFTTPTDIDKKRKELESEVSGLPTEALAQALILIKTAKKAKKW